ncbi:MAG: type II toxin-antitoxin system RelE/ParE family toxin [Thiohalomonadales bacterium]
MWIGKTKLFAKWAAKEGLTDAVLVTAINEIAEGSVEANLGGEVYKKRIALPGRGKRGSSRTILAFRYEDKAFFIYGFAKNEQANLKQNELKALKRYAKQLLEYDDKALKKMLKAGTIIEVANNG